MMDNWTKIPLGKLGSTYSGLSGKSKEDFGNGAPYITYTNIFSNGKVNPNMVDFVKVGKTEKQNKVKYGDILFTTSSETLEEVGMTSVLLDDLGEIYLNSFCFGFRLHDFETLLPEFAAYLLRSKKVRHQISFNGQGSTRYNLSKGQLLKNVVLNIPPKDEQLTIAKFLSSLDENIDTIKALIIKDERIKTGLMQDLLLKGIDKNGEIRSEETHEFKNSPIGIIPVEWKYFPLSKKANLLGGCAFKSKDFVENGIQLIRMGNLYENELRLDRSPVFLPKHFKKEYKKYHIKSGDIIMSMTGTYGKRDYGFAILIENGDFLLNQRLCKFIFDKTEIDTNFLLYLLKSEYYLDELFKSVTGSKQGNLKNSNILNVIVGFPEKDEQLRIVSVMKQQDENIDALKKDLQKLQRIKTGLMQDLLTGKVSVDALMKHSASTL
ncbi:MAG: restriction endonuclease subunit S [Bacteroidota bacterium]